MDDSTKIVVVDDEPSVRQVVKAYLEADGYQVHTADNGGDGLALVERLQPALVVLDLMLPDMSGEEVCRRIRRRSSVPIVMLTAKAGLDDRVSGLALGADDYVVKPFSPRELGARVRALLRRARVAQMPVGELIWLDGGRLTVDTARHDVSCAGRTVSLTPSEFKLLVALARYPGRVFTRGELIDSVQGSGFAGYERIIDAHIKNLRRKLEADPTHPRYVETVVGVGYKLSC